MVSSDQWKKRGRQMMLIVEKIHEKIYPGLKTKIQQKNYQFKEFFCGNHFDQEVQISLVGLKKELEEILKSGTIKDKYVKFDPQYR